MCATYVIYSERLKKKYVGSSEDPHRRFGQHNAGKSSFTSRSVPWTLKYVEYYETRQAAMVREIFLKTGAGRVFLARVLGNTSGYPEKEIPGNCLRYELI